MIAPIAPVRASISKANQIAADARGRQFDQFADCLAELVATRCISWRLSMASARGPTSPRATSNQMMRTVIAPPRTLMPLTPRAKRWCLWQLRLAGGDEFDLQVIA
jgi:hypothetical protein